MYRVYVVVALTLIHCRLLFAQIPIPPDAPKPLSPGESKAKVELPEGFQLELLAAEPLIRNPSGVCWDEKGRCFVCELHGYNMEGQFDIEELNKTGKLDKVVRRLPAPKHAQEKAEKTQTGTVKRLVDTNGDGRMDQSFVWADDLPSCFGIVPARQGVIVICSPDIVYLADHDGDDQVDERVVLFTGFNTGILERRMNAPKWGVDNWIYVGRGQGGTISGPHLKGQVKLPGNDFRFKADGSAIEPIPDGTHTFGFAFSGTGDRYVISTGTPAIYIAPIDWRYLSRNPFYSLGSMRVDVGPGNKTYPISKPHPWRSKRADDPGFEKFYRSRYGSAESTPNGFFTSACSPFVYQDNALPGLQGSLLACEPAQNMVHRSKVFRRGLVPRLERTAEESKKEFLASKDVWFHPMALKHAPDGSIAIVDFYREIIEDYSAIPRYLQQQYRLNHGEDHGRIWRLTHQSMKRNPKLNFVTSDSEKLVKEITSPRYWRRKTAQRLIVEQKDISVEMDLRKILHGQSNVDSKLTALHTLEGIQRLSNRDLETCLESSEPALVVESLKLADLRFDDSKELVNQALKLTKHPDERVQLQLALSLGESAAPEAKRGLAELLVNSGHVRWLPDAVLTSLRTGGEEFVDEFLKQSGAAENESRAAFLRKLSTIMANSRDAESLSKTIVTLARFHKDGVDEKNLLLRACLVGMKTAYSAPRPTSLSPKAKEALQSLAKNENKELADLAKSLVVLMRVETVSERQRRLAKANATVSDINAGIDERVSAVNELAAERDIEAIRELLSCFSSSTPAIKQAILDAAYSRSEYADVIVQMIDQKKLSLSRLSAVQRELLKKHASDDKRRIISQLILDFESKNKVNLDHFTKVLGNKRNLENGSAVFRKNCANCHQAHGLGVAVGPDLAAEFRRSEETFVQDIVMPSHSISAGYETFNVETIDGLTMSGLLAFESPTGIVLKQAEGKQVTVLRKDIERIRSVDISMMPENLGKTLSAKDIADVITWIRRPSQNRVLFDDDPAFLKHLVDGDGRVLVEHNDRQKGSISLRVSPPQRYSVRIANWNFKIRKNPKPGEYRYIRFAWKVDGAKGALIEIANRGSWPDAQSPKFRYYSGQNTTKWQATQVSSKAPTEWTLVTRDLWKDFGDSTVTGIAPTAMGGDVLFDSIELLRKAD